MGPWFVMEDIEGPLAHDCDKGGPRFLAVNQCFII